jgi:hypothetical protein
MANCYSKLVKLVKETPNNYDLGDKVRKMIWAEEDKINIQPDPNQLTIEDIINDLNNGRD